MRSNAYQYLLALARNFAAVTLNPGAWLPWNYPKSSPADRTPATSLAA